MQSAEVHHKRPVDALDMGGDVIRMEIKQVQRFSLDLGQQ